MDKYEYIVNLAEKTAKRVSQNRESWMKFLTSAARIYKYPFKEQLLIYAQNPDATACASIEIWNKRMNCWVNKGSSGIALPDDTATYGHKLKYVFDVSNVHAVKPNGRYPKAWKLREEHKSDVLHRLEQIYGSTDSTKPFEERIIEISDQLAADAYTELQIDYPDLQDRIGFDKLSEQDFALCIGSGFADGKFRIYEYFMDLHNQKENADFLKKEYGIGGQSGALPGNSSSNSEHDAKGILLEKGSLLNPYTKVLLNWNVVEERICELIYADKYFSPQEKEEYKNYKKEQEKKAKEAEITRLNNGIRLECKQEIEKQIAEKYNGFSVPQNTVSEIVEKYGIDCVQFVLANTIVQAWKEGRFSLRNKEWASSILTEGEWSNTLILNTHPTILDGFTNQVRNLQHEKEQVVQEQLTLDGHLCILIDQWESGNVKYLIGNCVDDPDFYYVQCKNRVFEFDHKPDKVEVEDYYIDILAEEDIDRHEAEVGAKLDGEELQRLSWQVVHEADDAFGNPTKWSARLFSDVFLWINKGNAVYSIYDAEGYPPLETFESLEDAMAWADELAADGRDIENSIPDETTPDTEEKQEIGPDPVGNIIRLDNVLKTMPDKLAEAKDRLETLTNQLESAKIEVTKPFQQEEELAEKLKRLAELNALLNMDEKGTDALILEDDEQPAIVNSDMAVTPITSVKTKPMLKKKVVGLCL